MSTVDDTRPPYGRSCLWTHKYLLPESNTDRFTPDSESNFQKGEELRRTATLAAFMLLLAACTESQTPAELIPTVRTMSVGQVSWIDSNHIDVDINRRVTVSANAIVFSDPSVAAMCGSNGCIQVERLAVGYALTIPEDPDVYFRPRDRTPSRSVPILEIRVVEDGQGVVRERMPLEFLSLPGWAESLAVGQKAWVHRQIALDADSTGQVWLKSRASVVEEQQDEKYVLIERRVDGFVLTLPDGTEIQQSVGDFTDEGDFLPIVEIVSS